MVPSFKIQNLGDAQANAPFTFGQVYAPGEMPAGHGLRAGPMQLQVDERVKHADGSIRHAIISGVLPAIDKGVTLDFQPELVDKVMPKPAASWEGRFSAAVRITVDGVVYTSPAAQNDQQTMLHGDIVTETNSTMIPAAEDGTKHQHLSTIWAVRDYGSNQEVDLTVENCWAFAPNPQNYTYDIEIVINGVVVHTETVTHYRQARTQWIFWSGAAPQLNVHIGNLIETKTVPPYDMSFPPNEQTLSSFADIVATNSGTMQTAAANGYFPMTGANSMIGLFPACAVAYIMSMDPRARDCTLATARCAGSYSMHYRDQNTGMPVSLVNYPYMTIEGNYGDTWNPYKSPTTWEAFPVPDFGPDGTLNQSPYTFDMAHQPELSLIAYLTSGRKYYLEEMKFCAMWNTFKSNPNQRNGSQGLIVNDQLRGQAWGLRTIAHAAIFSPDNDPQKAELNGFLNYSLDWYNETYPNNPNVDPGVHVMTHGYSFHDGEQRRVAPWMDDFFVSSLGHLLDLGVDKAMPIFQWKAQFTVDRLAEPGVCYVAGALYDLMVRDPGINPITEKPYLLYKNVLQCETVTCGPAFMALSCGSPEMGKALASFLGGAPIAGDMGGVSDGNMGYPSNMQPAINYSVRYNVPNAPEALQKFNSRSVKPDYAYGAQFAIIADAVIPPVTPPPEGTTMLYTVNITLQTTQVQLPPGSEATPTSTLVEILDSDKSTALAKTAVAPYSVKDISAGDRFVRTTDYDSKGVPMGDSVYTPFTIVEAVQPDVTATVTTGVTVTYAPQV